MNNNDFYKSFLINLIGINKYTFYKYQFLNSSTNKIDSHGDLFKLNFWKTAQTIEFEEL